MDFLMFLLKKIRNDSDYNRQLVANLEKIYFKKVVITRLEIL